MDILIVTGQERPANQVDFMTLPGEVVHPPLGMNAATITNAANPHASISHRAEFPSFPARSGSIAVDGLFHGFANINSIR
jgi:hypothetical protein